MAAMQAALAKPDAGAVPDQELEPSLAAVAEGVGAAVTRRATQTVLDALLEGVGPQALANRLGISQPAIQSYKRRLFEKLGISSQAELLRAAQELGNPTKASALG